MHALLALVLFAKICWPLVFSAHLLHICFSYLVLYQLIKFQYQTYFLSQDIKQNVFWNFCFANWWRHKLINVINGELFYKWVEFTTDCHSEGRHLTREQYQGTNCLQNDRCFVFKIKKRGGGVPHQCPWLGKTLMRGLIPHTSNELSMDSLY